MVPWIGPVPHLMVIKRREARLANIFVIEINHGYKVFELAYLLLFIICISICHHDLQYFPLPPLPYSFIIQSTFSESDSKSLRQGGGANMNNILLPVDINANLLFLQRVSWHHRKNHLRAKTIFNS